MADNQILVEIKGKSEQMVEAVDKASKKLEELAEATKRAESGWNGFLGKLGNFGMATEGIKNVGGWLMSSGKALLGTYVELGAELDSISRRTNISIESLSQLKYAAEQSGIGFETLTDAIKTYSEQIGAAQLGDQGARDKLAAVGVDFNEYMGLGEKDQFLKLAEHISKIKNSAEQTRTAIELFGDSGYQLLPFFQQGEAGIRKLCEQADELGFTFRNDDAAEAAELSSKLAVLKSSFESTGRSLVSALVEPLTALANGCSEAAQWVAKWIQDHPTLTKGFVFLAGGIAAAGAALTAFSIVSTAFMATNPLGWVLLGIGAVAGLTAALLTASDTMTGFEDDVKDADEKLAAMNATAGETQKIFDSFKEENAALVGLVDQIQAMCDKEQLSNAEKQKMIELVRQLQDEFPGLNFQIDEASGKMKDLTQRYIDMQKAAAEKKVGDLQQQYAKYGDEKLRAEVDFDFAGREIERKFGRSLGGIGYKLTDSDLSWEERQKIADESGYDDVKQAFAAYRKYGEVVEGWRQKLEETKKAEEEVRKAAQGNIQEYVTQRASQALAKVQEDERAADEKTLNEFQKRGREIAKEYDRRIENLENYKKELENLKENGGLSAEQEARLGTIDSEIESLQDERSAKYEVLADEMYKKKEDAEKEAAKRREDILKRIMTLTGELNEEEKSAAEKKLEDLKAQNVEYLKQLELKKGITREELETAKAEAARRERELAESLIKEGAAAFDPNKSEVNAAEQALIEAQHNGGDVEGAQARLEEAKKKAEEASYQKALKDLKDAKVKADLSKTAYNQAAKDETTDPAELLRLQQKATEDSAVVDAAMENFRKFTKPIDAKKEEEEKPTEKPMDTTIGSTTKGTFSIYGMGATVDNTPAQQLDYLRKIYMLLGLFDKEPAVRLV